MHRLVRTEPRTGPPFCLLACPLCFLTPLPHHFRLVLTRSRFITLHVGEICEWGRLSGGRGEREWRECKGSGVVKWI